MSFGVCVVAGLLSGFGFGYSSTAGTALSAGLLLDMKAKDGEVGANGMGMFQVRPDSIRDCVDVGPKGEGV